MVSLTLKETYLQVPIHPDSRKFLRSVAFNRVYQFRALCFGLSTAPQVFTRVMAPVSSILHGLGIRNCRYLDGWIIQALSREDILRSLETVFYLCLELGIVVNPVKSNFVPAQRAQYLGTILDCIFQGFFLAESREASLNRRRIPGLQAAARFVLTGPTQDSLPFSSRSGRSHPHAAAPSDTPSLLGQGGRFCSGSME